MKKILMCLCFILLSACVHRNPLSDMHFQTVMAPPYVIASWYKITAPGQPVKFYIEGLGQENYPNPDSELMRNLAKSDDSPNVVYIALPCQYGMRVGCAAENAPALDKTLVKGIDTVVQTMMKKASSEKMILVGYDVGAGIATDLALQYRPYVIHLVTVGGIWQHDLPRDVLRVAQTHYRGEKDSVAPIEQVPSIFPPDSIVPVSWADHTGGYWRVRKYIWNIR